MSQKSDLIIDLDEHHPKEKTELIKRKLKEKIGMKQLLGKNPVFLGVVEKISIVSKCEATVLITGETGTGKELCARVIHYLSKRSPYPFIPVNCGGIPISLFENELFGHVKGAFTDAYSYQHGLIREAEGGTLFLDEIGLLSLLAQTKLLRFLQEGEYKPLGSDKILRGDARIIVATNMDLLEKIKKGTFREDLYYRVSVIPLSLPPIREREEDIPILANHFLKRYSEEYGKEKLSFSKEALQKLFDYDWPGNIRELENIIQRSVIMASTQTLSAQDIVLPGSASAQGKKRESFKEAKAKIVKKFETDYIIGLLMSNRGNITRAACEAGKNRRAFWELMRKYNIKRSSPTFSS